MFFMNYRFHIVSSIVSLQGLFIFVTLVTNRQRMRKAIAIRYLAKYNFVPPHWRTEKDLESSSDSDDNNENDQQENDTKISMDAAENKSRNFVML